MGVETAAIVAGVLGAGGNIISGIMGSDAANKASKTEAEALDKAIALQGATYQQGRIDAYPWAMAGAQALYQLMDELGVSRPVEPILPDLNSGPFGAQSNTTTPTTTTTATTTPTTSGWQFYPWGGNNQNQQPTTPTPATPTPTAPALGVTKDTPMTQSLGFRQTPGYEFQVAEGEKAVLNNAAALGMKNSGAALKGLTRYRQGIADQTYNNYLDRLSAMSVGGQSQVGATNALGANTAMNIGQALGQQGVARASGYVGSANALGAGISGAANAIGGSLGWLNGNKGWAA